MCQIPKFYLFFWFKILVETQNAVSGDVPNILQKLCVSTKVHTRKLDEIRVIYTGRNISVSIIPYCGLDLVTCLRSRLSSFMVEKTPLSGRTILTLVSNVLHEFTAQNIKFSIKNFFVFSAVVEKANIVCLLFL